MCCRQRILLILLDRDPFVNFNHILIEYIRPDNVKVEQLWPRLCTYAKCITKAFCDEKSYSLAFSFEQCIGSDSSSHANTQLCQIADIEFLVARDLGIGGLFQYATNAFDRSIIVVVRVLTKKLDYDVFLAFYDA